MENRWCECYDGKIKPKAIFDEVVEFVKKPSKDEASDIAWCFARVLGNIFGVCAVPIPGIGLHIEKINKRYNETGCVRSENHLAEITHPLMKH